MELQEITSGETTYENPILNKNKRSYKKKWQKYAGRWEKKFLIPALKEKMAQSSQTEYPGAPKSIKNCTDTAGNMTSKGAEEVPPILESVVKAINQLKDNKTGRSNCD